jgi:4-aminobutyrate aminotransferase-like enzyme
LAAVTLPTTGARDQLLAGLFARELVALPSGPTSVRFRLPLIINAAEVDEILNRVEAVAAG